LGHIKALNALENIKGCEPINLGTGNGTSVLDIIKSFERISERKVPYQISPRRAGDIATVFANAEKAQHILGWKTEKDLNAMIEDTWRWQSQNPNGFE
jgi:UDP-glucose 4-epimerase